MTEPNRIGHSAETNIIVRTTEDDHILPGIAIVWYSDGQCVHVPIDEIIPEPNITLILVREEDANQAPQRPQ